MSGRALKTLLVANRGEAAVRVLRTARAMGLRTAVIFAGADRGAPHAEAADEAHEVPSYLDLPAILAAAKAAKADAIHPGWGFLSQNPRFPEACDAAGIAFVGPPAAAMRRMGDKHAARETAISAGVPVVPGSGLVADEAAALAAARRIGLPVMVKAAGGGGGKGLRRIAREEDLAAGIAAARREADAAFGDGRLFVEKLVAPARHVEIQVLGDAHGTVLSLGERDCTLQRRFQKIVEEAPSPAVDAGLRARMGDAAVRLARAAGYVNAGTVEFLLQPDGTFYFMEMNTRLQVEHPVTEAVLGIDLVRLQLEVARGDALALRPGPPRGHALEARIYAEDPDAGFLPMSGRVLSAAWPEGVRVEHAVRDGMVVTPDFDPMLAKIVAHGSDREEARRRLVDALRATALLGVQTNVSWLLRLLETRAFRDGDLAVGTIPEVPPEELPLAVWAAAVAPRCNASAELTRYTTLWERPGRWRIGE